MPVFTEVLAADGSTVYNVYDEPQRRNPVTGEEMTWDLLTINLGSANGNGYVSDLANEQDASLDNNSEQAPQTFSWSAATNPAVCDAFSVSVQSNTLVIDLSENNEAGGTCDIVLDLSDGASVFDAAASVSVPFTINPVNDQPEILDWNVSRGAYITTSYLDSNGDEATGKITDTTATHEPWYWQVNEDTTDEDLLTIDLSRMMSDNDHTIDQLSWDVDQTQASMDQCNYHNYFEISIDNINQELSLILIPDATTDADSSEWDMLQDADGDGSPDDGIHQKSPRSGTFCSVTLWMNDTATAPSQYDYAQSATGTYSQGSSSETLYIRVHNQVEARPDFNFDETRISPQPLDFQGIDGVLRETLVPVSVALEMEGDEPTNADGTYKYLYDLRVSFYTSEVAGGQGTYQGSVRLGSNGPGDGDMALPSWGGSTEVLSYARLNKTSEDVRVFVDIMTVNPFTGQYTDNSKYEKPALEEKNWADNNMSSSQTNSELPLIVEVRAAASVASFAPTLMAVGLVGVFVGALLSRSRAIEDEEEFEENSLVDDERAVSPVIATILLVAITVVLAGVIYVWAGSLADTSTKGVPQLTFSADSITVQEVSNLPQDQWHWRITTTYAATDLATQAIKVSVLWNNASGQQVYTTALAPTSGDIEHVYGFAPRNSQNMVTFWDDVSACEKGGAPCITQFGAGDRIFVRMTDNDGLIDSAQIDIKYELPGGAAYVLKQYTASANSIR
jgi:flagellin-like protein